MGPNMSSVSGSKRRNDIQVLRAIAVIAVIVFHLDESWLRGGFLGVDVFFVISGFLITGILTRGLSEGSFSIWNFYLRRIKRLFPALALVLWVTVLLAIVSMPPLPFDGLMEHMPWASLQVSNFSFMRGVDYFATANEINPVLHTWSLGVEEQFYLTWAPFLAFCFWLRKKRHPTEGNFRPVSIMLTVIAIGVAAEFFTVAKFGATVSFFSPFSRMWELALGGLASTVFRSASHRLPKKLNFNVLSITGFLMMLISFFWLSESASSNPLMRAIPCLGAFLVLLFPIRLSVECVRPVLKAGVYVGDISYSLYLWHWPVICLAPYLTGLPDSGGLVVTTVLMFTVMAIASYHLCEKRFMNDVKWKRFLSLRSSTAIGLLMMIGGGAYALRSEEKAEWRFMLDEYTADEAAWTWPAGYSEIRAKHGDDFLFSRVSDAEVVLIGDSHARHFAPVVQSWVDRVYGGDLFVFTAGGFFAVGTDVAFREVDKKGDLVRMASRSGDSRRLLQSITESAEVKVVFIALRSGLYTMPLLPCEFGDLSERLLVEEADPDSEKPIGEIYEEQTLKFIDSLVSSGKSVVLMGQTTPLPFSPSPGSSILDHLFNRKQNSGTIPIPHDYAGRVDLENRVYLKAAKHPQVYYLPTREIITTVYGEDGKHLYNDFNHLRYQGAMSVFQPLKQLLEPLIPQAAPETER